MRSSLQPRPATAFAPGAITNFFGVNGQAPHDSDYSTVGATGGGYILSRGVVSKAVPDHGGLKIVVDGDPHYDARTTRRAVESLLSAHGFSGPGLRLEQETQVPVGCGFGASAASAISACYAVAASLGIEAPKSELAYHAHVADIVERTGLGTVSVSYDAVGAGAIVTMGAPGVAKFHNVECPRDLRIVTASLRPYDKKDAISNEAVLSKIRSLGAASLGRFLRSPDLETLASEGEAFSRGLGLMTPELASLADTALTAGASHASQNMIGYAIHALATKESADTVEKALVARPAKPRVDVFEVGTVRAGATVD